MVQVVLWKLSRSILAMGGARKKHCPRALLLPPAAPPQKKTLMVTKCPLGTLVTHAKMWNNKRHSCTKTLIFVDFLRFQILKIKKNLRLSLHVQRLKVFQLQGGFAPDLWPGALSLDPATSFPCTSQLNKFDIWAVHKKLIAPSVPSVPWPLRLHCPTAASDS